jgi:hypothetical protein
MGPFLIGGDMLCLNPCLKLTPNPCLNPNPLPELFLIL